MTVIVTAVFTPRDGAFDAVAAALAPAIAEVHNGEEDHLLELAERFPSHAAPAFGDVWCNGDKNIQR